MALFFQGIKQIGNNFCVISLKTYTKKTKHSKFYYSFQLSFFFNLKARSQSIYDRIISFKVSYANKTPLQYGGNCIPARFFIQNKN